MAQEWNLVRSTAYSFDAGLSFAAAVTMLDAVDDWLGKPDLKGRWLVRYNDYHGDYLSVFRLHETHEDFSDSLAVFFDTTPKQITVKLYAVGLATDSKQRWQELLSNVLGVLLPSLGARNIKPSDFER